MADRPNILIFMTDQERADVTAPDHPCMTPHTDRLAQEGIRFTQTYCPSPHCCPSRATFMSGLYPSRHGIFNNIKTRTAINTGLKSDVVLFSEQLREAGYRNVLCGKWHVSGDEDPKDRGWEERAVTGAGATFHGGGLNTANPDSPHLGIPDMDARMLICIAANDDERDPESKNVLRAAFDAAGVPAEIEVYAGANHGWCVIDSAVYNQPQAERAWSRLLATFETALS